MKSMIIIHVLLALLALSCNLVGTKSQISQLIPGTYIRFSHHEFGTEYDTIVITLQNQIANEYRIIRKWKYERMRDGVLLEPEYKRQTTSAIFNLTTAVLQDSESGDTYTFDTNGKTLFNGTIKYQKL